MSVRGGYGSRTREGPAGRQNFTRRHHFSSSCGGHGTSSPCLRGVGGKSSYRDSGRFHGELSHPSCRVWIEAFRVQDQSLLFSSLDPRNKLRVRNPRLC